MRKKLSCLGYIILLAIWAAVMAFPFATFRLAQEGEFQVRNTRVFLLSERDLGGVGFQSTSDASSDNSCQQTRVRFIMWEGESSNSRACSCEDGIERVPDGRACVDP